jgi:Fe2+ transport system protein FeoA
MMAIMNIFSKARSLFKPKSLIKPKSLFEPNCPEEGPPGPGPVIPLSKAPTGQELRLVKIQAGRKLTHRLAELGLTPGVKLRVVQKNGGPLLISVRGSRIAIGRGMAHKLLVGPSKLGFEFECEVDG